MSTATEINFDGLVGPTHNYGGLPTGNLASAKSKANTSNPKQAALEGLEKMRLLAEHGIPQAILPPHERPHLPTLRQLGFSGNDSEILKNVYQHHPRILAQVTSAAAMWTANAATMTTSVDSQDGRVHFTPANLVTHFYRSIETATTSRILKKIFADENYFIHHEALPSSPAFGDEGAANHTRFCSRFGEPGLHVFVYGRTAFDKSKPSPKIFPARQTREASEMLARQHQIIPERCAFIQQNPMAIDAGAFHNDVVAVGHKNFLFYHEDAFLGDPAPRLMNSFEKISGNSLLALKVRRNEVPLSDAVSSYLFNSQIVSLPNGTFLLIAPQECEENPSVKTYLNHLLQNKNQPLRDVVYARVRQSMMNGGGPACLRLRVELTSDEKKATLPDIFWSPEKHAVLKNWIQKHYRDELCFDDFADVKILEESRTALDELTKILNLGSVYDFQIP